MRTRISRGCVATPSRSLTGVAAALLVGCTALPGGEPVAPSALDAWLAGTAAPAVTRWQSQLPGSATVEIIPAVGEAAPVSELTYDAAADLASALRRAGIAADLPDAARAAAANEHACARGEPTTLRVSLSIAPVGTADPARAGITVRSLTDPPAVAGPLVATQLVLSRRELGKVRVLRSLPAALGTPEQPYASAQLDQMLAEITQTLRCDLLRARWRMGAARVAWDVAQPAPWYRSLGLRLRDELARLDIVNGAPGSPNTVARLELRAEPTSDVHVLRIVARAAAGDTAGIESVVWYQTYYHAPGPAAVPDPPTRVAATATPTPVAPPPTTPEARPAAPSLTSDPRKTSRPTTTAQVPQRPSPEPTPTAPVASPRLADVRIGGFRALKLGSSPTCTGMPRAAGQWFTGDCIALELSAVNGDALYLLHQDADDRLSRIAPSTCASMARSRVWPATFRVPAGGADASLIRLTPPSGRERFMALAVGTGADPVIHTVLASLPDACAENATGQSATSSRRLLDTLLSETRRGRAALRTLVLTHTDPLDETADRLISR